MTKANTMQAMDKIQAQTQAQDQAQHLNGNEAQEERSAQLQEAACNIPGKVAQKETEPRPEQQNRKSPSVQPEKAGAGQPNKTEQTPEGACEETTGEATKQKMRTKAGKRTLMAFVEEIYLPHIRLRKRSWSVDARLARRFIYPSFGSRELGKIRAIEVEKWLDRLTCKLAPSSCNRVLAVFKTICSFAVRLGLVPQSATPCSGVFSLKLQAPRERYLSPDEAGKLMSTLEKSERQEAQALRLLLLTGARKNEILKARWENVHLDLHMISVPISKSGKTRHIFLSDAARDILAGLKSRGKSPWVFPGRTPRKPISDIFAYWKEVRDELNLADVRIHDLRHTFASFLVNAGHTLYEAQKMLGHADPRTTMRYAHLGQNALVTAAETVSKLLGSGAQAQAQAQTQAQTQAQAPTEALA